MCMCTCVYVPTCVLGVAVHTSKPLQRGLGSPGEQESLLFCRDGLGCVMRASSACLPVEGTCTAWQRLQWFFEDQEVPSDPQHVPKD